jgi:hypothetical protein
MLEEKQVVLFYKEFKSASIYEVWMCNKTVLKKTRSTTSSFTVTSIDMDDSYWWSTTMDWCRLFGAVYWQNVMPERISFTSFCVNSRT